MTSALVLDVIYVIQGIEGKHISCTITGAENISVKPSCDSKFASISSGEKNLAMNICELGFYFLSVKVAAQKMLNTPKYGLVVSSFGIFLQSMINEYLSALSSVNRQMSSSVSNISLRKLFYWSRKPLRQFKLLDRIIKYCFRAMDDNCLFQANGSILLSNVIGSNFSACEVETDLVSDLRKMLIKPFKKFLLTWLMEGKLYDPYNEFFIERCNNVDSVSTRFQLKKNRIPCFMNEDLIRVIFDQGKSILFLLHFKKQRLNEEEEKQLRTEIENICCDNNIRLKLSLLKIYHKVCMLAKSTNKELLSVVFEKYSLQCHLQAMREIMLLMNSNFSCALVGKLAEQFQKDRADIYEHTLHFLLDTIFHSSFSGFCSNTLYKHQSLSVEEVFSSTVVMLEKHKENDLWNCFRIAYKLPKSSPLCLVITEDSQKRYSEIFSFQLRIKRLMFVLLSFWKQMKLLKNELLGLPLQERDNIAESLVHCFFLRGEMSSFLSSLENYLLLQVFDEHWKHLCVKLTSIDSFDGVVDAHETYTSAMVAEIKQIWQAFELVIQAIQEYVTVVSQLLGIVQKYTHLQTRLDDTAQEVMLVKLKMTKVAAEITDITSKYKRNVSDTLKKLKRSKGRENIYVQILTDIEFGTRINNGTGYIYLYYSKLFGAFFAVSLFVLKCVCLYTENLNGRIGIPLSRLDFSSGEVLLIEFESDKLILIEENDVNAQKLLILHLENFTLDSFKPYSQLLREQEGIWPHILSGSRSNFVAQFAKPRKFVETYIEIQPNANGDFLAASSQGFLHLLSGYYLTSVLESGKMFAEVNLTDFVGILSSYQIIKVSADGLTLALLLKSKSTISFNILLYHLSSSTWMLYFETDKENIYGCDVFAVEGWAQLFVSYVEFGVLYQETFNCFSYERARFNLGSIVSSYEGRACSAIASAIRENKVIIQYECDADSLCGSIFKIFQKEDLLSQVYVPEAVAQWNAISSLEGKNLEGIAFLNSAGFLKVVSLSTEEIETKEVELLENRTFSVFRDVVIVMSPTYILFIDLDKDNDKVLDFKDVFPHKGLGSSDTDADGIPDSLDLLHFESASDTTVLGSVTLCIGIILFVFGCVLESKRRFEFLYYFDLIYEEIEYATSPDILERIQASRPAFQVLVGEEKFEGTPDCSKVPEVDEFLKAISLTNQDNDTKMSNIEIQYSSLVFKIIKSYDSAQNILLKSCSLFLKVLYVLSLLNGMLNRFFKYRFVSFTM
eukprot:snap_masked-scaffold_1-processed-gene-26.23-mRNA-1 protein AED:1.00 eAED:1.00 QI:0/0/0/0/1/1/6/0/1236